MVKADGLWMDETRECSLEGVDVYGGSMEGLGV